MIDTITILGNLIMFILGLFSTYIILNFMSKFERNIYYSEYAYIFVYLIFTLIIFISKMFCSNTLNLIISIIITIVIGHFFYNNKKIFILYYSIYIIVLIVFQVGASYLFQIICTCANINFYSLDIFLITTSIVTQFSNLSASRLFLIWYKNKKIKMISMIQYLNFLILPIFSIFYITVLMMYIQVYLSIEDTILLLISITSIIILNIFITNIFESISKNNELKNKILLYEQQCKMQYEYYSNLDSKYRSSRKIIHDMKNHLQTIEELYKFNQNEKAQQYSKNMYKLFDKFVQKYYTSNRVLNIIINDKAQRAEVFCIDFNCKIGEVTLEFIEDIDLTTIFSNLLDNAIEGTKNVFNDKYICLKVDKFNDFIVINITNSINSKPIKSKEIFKSTKKNHEAIGLINVKMALEKYKGDMRIDYSDKVFKVNIVIPMC